MNTLPTLVPEASSAKHCLRVLVVDDNPINREVARRMLERRGHLVVTVEDGSQGLFEWQKGVYDLILMDIHMPVLDGPATTRKIRELEKARGGHVPIIALTANVIRGTEKECLASGMDAYITKPLQRDYFIKTVEDTVEKIRARVASRQLSAALTIPAAPSAEVEVLGKRLICVEYMAKLVGYDVELQKKVLHLCVEALSAKIPLYNRAMRKGDREVIKQLAHYLRGSLGMLGLPTLVKIGAEIENDYDTLGAKVWQQRCEQFRTMLYRLSEELRQLHAA